MWTPFGAADALDRHDVRAGRAAVRLLGEDEIAPKTVPQGYTTRAPAAVSHAVPDHDRAEPQP